MYNIFYSALIIFWIFDVLNMPFMEMFDTTYPINGWAWLLIWLFVPGAATIVKYENKDD